MGEKFHPNAPANHLSIPPNTMSLIPHTKFLGFVGNEARDTTRSMSGFREVPIMKRKQWAPHLITLTLDIIPPDFTPGQFFNLGLLVGGDIVRRSYSAASAPGAPLEFFLSEVGEGEFTPQLFALEAEDPVLLDEKPLGFFTLAEVPPARVLWLVATGTGLGPFVSMLRAGQVFDQFEKIIVVHGVRHESQLAYRPELENLVETRSELSYIPVLSRTQAPHAPAVFGRITTCFQAGQLEERAHTTFNGEAHMLLCGNPQMIEDMGALLKDRGFEKHRRKKPGHFNFEKYW